MINELVVKKLCDRWLSA